MEKTCKKCDNNLYGNRLRCPFCGEPIKNTSAISSAMSKQSSNHQYRSNQFNYTSKPTPQQRKRNAAPLGPVETLILLALSFFVPPFGVVFFFGFNKDRQGFSYLALLAGIVGFVRYMS